MLSFFLIYRRSERKYWEKLQFMGDLHSTKLRVEKIGRKKYYGIYYIQHSLTNIATKIFFSFIM